MKCNIVKDLLPLYCDNLTSEDSNEEIEKHLSECADCKAVYESMNKKEENIEVPEKDVKPLKKVKKRTKLKIIATVLGTAVVLFGVFMFVFWGVVPINSEKLHYTVEVKEVKTYMAKSDELDENGEYIMEYRTEFSDDFYPIPEGVKVKTEKWIDFEFTGDCSCTNERTDSKYVPFVNDKGVNDFILHEHLWIYPVVKLPFDDRGKYPNQYLWGTNDVKEGSTLTIHYRDKTETIDLYKLYQDTVKNQK
ncbi:zf-HC2 domain-containing protein [Ruminococcus flavefaciens]|uniref:Putative zinc-finger domain-containing protein n=1 Tax=Ruminococcus flavefaciens 007c TaxID=1341157 RepID=W7UN02_RUMFL|nr:zf-HC2 domain-containing protein [Ruminococcus flavefaciens]EWM52969.1 hypothetical protein RF007C_15255 [Ruminococcus flavefaciens 007c]